MSHDWLDCFHPWRIDRHPQRYQPNGTFLLHPGGLWMVRIITELFKKETKKNLKSGEAFAPFQLSAKRTIA